ncbi:sensor histidine kinase [Alkaliphilus oremlandii]|uniref:histidine kinase n=1 Tax=Alkaliphilus oremlandii (strain OhILAs) TaxID=350688 RepID=A8MK99_ALKOO|nr:sensor histidine kinase [Alkaliphilus oremlandii]ABW20231.1 integral membrane sensor signal transduction histidine kinase [Alkaliphilus oremlandii OhILAs]
MDINLNNQNDKDPNDENRFEKKKKSLLSSSFATALFTLIFAVVSVVSYIPIRNAYFGTTESHAYEYLESDRFLYQHLTGLTRKLQQSMNGTNDGYDDSYVNIKSVQYKMSYAGETKDENTVIKTLDQAFRERSRNDFIPYQEVTSYKEEQAIEIGNGELGEEGIGVRDEGVKEEKREESIEAVVNRNKILTNLSDISELKLQKNKENSLLYLKITFDQNGVPSIESGFGKKSKLENFNINRDVFAERLVYSNLEDLKDYQGLEVEYIIPSDFVEYDDIFTYGMKDSYAISNYAMVILIIGAISVLILMITAFAVPYESQNKASIIRLFNKMFLELKFVVWGLLMLLIAGVFEMVSNYRYYGYGSRLAALIYDADGLFYMIGIPLTFLLYFLIYLSTVYLKYIYHKGLKEGLIDNSFFGKICLYCVRKARNILRRMILRTKNMVNTLMAIDLKEDNQRKLIGIGIMNFLVIVILGSGGFFGFVLAAIYSVLVLRYITDLLEKAKELNIASEQVSAGNFNINLNEDMGILTPLAKNLNNINIGFSLAVDKEIKSQRMKAELISNVSHDLKTPLTSIITYVDLLKNEEIDRDTQREYIGILDKKSQRLKILIEDLFEASKATSGNIELHLEKVDVVALFRQTLGELEEKINGSSLQFKISTPDNKVICNLDGRRTYRVFENIMTNILKYAMENSRVYIDITESIHEVSFTFKNISAYEMNFDANEITERFTRGDESRNTEGSGLGLSIAKSFIELQGGTLEIIIDGDLFKLIVVFPKA